MVKEKNKMDPTNLKVTGPPIDRNRLNVEFFTKVLMNNAIQLLEAACILVLKFNSFVVAGNFRKKMLLYNFRVNKVIKIPYSLFTFYSFLLVFAKYS